MGPIQLSGPDTSAVKVSVDIKGNVRGGQNPVIGSLVQLWSVGTGGYGSAATNIIGLYPNGSACSTAPDPITAYAVAAGSVTFTANNTLQVGQLVSVSGLSSGSDAVLLDGQTYTVTAATAATFTAAAPSGTTTATTTADSGTAIPQCAGSTANGNAIVSDGNGGFSITGDYTCPSSTTQVYLTATGGNPGLTAGTKNSAIKMITPLGPCGNLSASTSVILSEVTTAATAFALGQYFTTTFGSASTDSFGAPNTTQAQTGFANAVATVGNLVSLSSGNAITSTNLTGAGYTITVVPESAKLNTIADVLSACVNSLGTSDPNGNCNTLFADVTPTGGTAPTDILQAAVDMSLNPTSGSPANITALYNLSTGTGSPFAGLSAAPTDWTLGIQYQDNTGTFLLKPQNIAIDGGGNVWVLSNSGGTGGLVELSPVGKPSYFLTSINTYGPFALPLAAAGTVQTAASLKTTSAATFGYQTNLFTGSFGTTTAPATNPRNLSIDTSNNVWFTTSSSSGADTTTGYTLNGGIVDVPAGGGTANAFSTGKGAYSLSIDNSNNVYVGEQSSSAYFGLYMFPAGNLLTPITFQNASKTAGTAAATGTNTYLEAEYSAFDTSGNLWLTGANAVNTYNYAVELGAISTASCQATLATAGNGNFCQTSTSTTANTFNTFTLSGVLEPWQIATGTSNSIWIGDPGVTASSGYSPDYTITKISPTSTTNPPTPTLTNYGSTTSVTVPHYIATDGSGNVWVGSQTLSNSAGSALLYIGGISEFSPSGAVLSPTVATQNVNTPPGFAHYNYVADPPATNGTTGTTNVGLESAAGIAVDPSGNVWIANNGVYTAAVAATATAPGTPAIPSFILEIVGAATPIVTPIAATTTTGPVKP